MQRAENRPTDDRSLSDNCGRYRTLLPQAPVRSFMVVVTDEFHEKGVKMPLVDHDQVVQTLLAKRPHRPLRDRVRPWRPNRCPDAPDPEPAEFGFEVAAVDRVAVMNQMAGPAAPGRGVDHLLPDPRSRRAGGHVEMNQLPSLVGD